MKVKSVLLYALGLGKVSDKDAVLKNIIGTTTDNPLNLASLDFIDDPLYSLFYKHRIELQKAGYINYQTNKIPPIDPRAPLKITLTTKEEVSITDDGKLFLNNGGYTKQRIKKIVDTVWNRGSILIALGAAIVSYCTYDSTKFDRVNSEKIESLNKRIDSITKRINRLDSVAIRKHSIKPDSSKKRGK